MACRCRLSKNQHLVSLEPCHGHLTLIMLSTKKFVADYKAKYGGYPSFYAAQAYDTILAVDHAIATSGSKDTDKMRAVLAKGNIPTTRGLLKMNSNHFPIQNFYLRDTVQDADGVVTSKVVSTVFTDHADSYASSCKF
jgi:branched-chain amino acid transport system substrate-binding protein